MPLNKIPLAKTGWLYLLISIIIALLSSFLLCLKIFSILFWLITIWIIWFFRDPNRHITIIPEEAIISPADGKIVTNKLIFSPNLSWKKVRLISIFMNIFNVHVNRAPASGQVLAITHYHGRYLPANWPQAQESNERLAIILNLQNGDKVTIVQVAGLIARRIKCWISPGDFIQKGQRYGMICFGSRVDLYLPPTVKVKINLGEKVRAGETILGIL